jgi:hypothetical protein
MATINAAALTTLLKDTVTDATAEACLVQAIDAINLEGLAFGVSVAELSGTPLTGTYLGYQKAAIIQVATAVYSQNYKNSGASNSASESIGVGGLSMSNSSSSSVSSSGNSSSIVNSVAHDMVIAILRAQGRHFLRA